MQTIMDPTKKRKLEDNGFGGVESDHLKLSPSEARKVIERFTPDQLLNILQDAVVRHPDVLSAARKIADTDITQRKLFVRGLGWDTTTDGLRSLFSTYGELEEAIVINDKATGKSKGYGFVTFRHVDGALLALREPSKRIDGRVTVTQLASAGNSGSNTNASDIALRKIYVSNVPPDLAADKLLAHFSLFGEIEEGPLGFDKLTGRSKGFALFVYKTPEGAQAALLEPVKNVEGRQLNCKMAITDGKQQGMRGGPGPEGVQNRGNAHGNGMGMAPAAGPGSGQYGGSVGMGSYGGFSGGHQGQPPMGNHPLNSSVGGGLSSVGNQAPSSMGSAGGYGGGHYGGYGGPAATGFGGSGGGGGGGGSGYGGGSGVAGAGLGAGSYGGGSGVAGGGLGGSAGGLGAAGSLYRLPSSGGMQAGAYPDSGHYSSSGYQNQHHPPAGASPVPRVQPGSMYPNVPYY